MNETERKAAVQRVIARGSIPEATAEAEGDFGPDGIFAPETHMNETCDRCGKPIHWVETEQKFYHDNLGDIFVCGAIVIVPTTAEV